MRLSRKETTSCTLCCRRARWPRWVGPRSSDCDVTSSSLLFRFPLDCVSSSPADDVVLLKNAQTCHWGALSFLPWLFSGPLQSTLGVVSPSSVSSVVPLTCVVHSCSSPFYHEVSLVPLKKKKKKSPEAPSHDAVFSLFSIVSVSVRGKPNKLSVPSNILSFMRLNPQTENDFLLLSLCRCTWRF